VLRESGKPAVGFPVFLSVVEAVEMWESRSDFQARCGAEGNLMLVFLGVHGAAFPPPVRVHAVRLGWNIVNSFRLACCIAAAASVSLQARAWRWRLSTLWFAVKVTPASSQTSSQGVA
jgi:hypothetical protein